jgi:tRNA(fMet)-specific endonuclease VapC
MACLDTNFIIDIIKGKISIETLNKLEDNSLSIASPSIVEIIRGLHLKSTSQNIKHNEEEKIENILNSLNILQLNKENAKAAGKIQAQLVNKGEDIGIMDIMIAAIAITNNEILITRNKKHFEKIEGLKIETY